MKIECLESKEFYAWVDEIIRVRQHGAFGSTEENYLRQYIRTEIKKLVEEETRKAIEYTVNRFLYENTTKVLDMDLVEEWKQRGGNDE